MQDIFKFAVKTEQKQYDMRTFINEEKFSELTGSAAFITLVGHLNPDGDAIGSLSGMYHYLSARGKQAAIVLNNPLPDSFGFLTAGLPIFYYDDAPEKCIEAVRRADLIICQDMSAPSRAGDISAEIENASCPKILIDHHLNPAVEWFDTVISDTEVSSASELVLLTLLKQEDVVQDVQKLPLKCATALLTGILTDTNNFSNSVFPTTYDAAKLLQQRGADRDFIYREVFCSFSEQRMRLMGYLLAENMRYMPESGTAYFTLSKNDKKNFSFLRGDSEGFVNLPLAIKNVSLTALFTEDDGFVKVSLRSKGDVDVNEFSHRYCNGGGHKNAAGGRVYLPFEEIPSYFEKCIGEFFAR